MRGQTRDPVQSSPRSSLGQDNHTPRTLPATVIVLNWNGRRWIDECLASLLALDPLAAEILFVDNHSSDDSVAHVRAHYPGVRILALPDNRGFAAGNNAGAAAASQPHLVFLNNDTRVEPGWLASLLAPVAQDAGVGISTSRVVFMAHPDVLDSAGDGYLRCGGAFKRGHGQAVSTALESREVFGACGAAFAIRRELFEALHGFDGDFFMVYEDVDLSYRAQLRGARCMYAAGAVVHHAGSGSIGRVSDATVFHGQRNLEWTWLKNTPAALLWRSWLPHVIYDVVGALAYARRGQFGVWCRAKLSALAGLPAVLRKRRAIQREAVADAGRLWSLMEPDWIAIKRQEKAFDFGRFSRS
jgi:GT2 family glycosyltransferase